MATRWRCDARVIAGSGCGRMGLARTCVPTAPGGIGNGVLQRTGHYWIDPAKLTGMGATDVSIAYHQPNDSDNLVDKKFIQSKVTAGRIIPLGDDVQRPAKSGTPVRFYGLQTSRKRRDECQIRFAARVRSRPLSGKVLQGSQAEAESMKTQFWLGVALTGMIAAMAIPQSAHSIDEMSYRSDSNSSRNSGTPEDSARPGESYFYKAVKAIGKKDYKFAVDMYEVAASWAYKPAQYNLGVMYVTGEGVPMDKPRGLAWLALAAERSDHKYVAARESVREQLNAEEIGRANVILDDLKGTYADDIALQRAKNRWAQVRAGQTGSHLGAGPGPLLVSGNDPTAPAATLNTPKERPALSATQSASGIVGANATDGSNAYKQFRQSDNPYDKKFKPMTGTATVQPLVPADESGDPAKPPPQAKSASDKDDGH